MSERLDIIQHVKGPVAVFAGAGTGKTSLIVERLQYLMQHTSTNQIIILTFNKKAVQHLRHRVTHTSIPMPHIITFHQLGREIIIEHDPKAVFLSDEEKQNVLHPIIQQTLEPLLHKHKSYESDLLRRLQLTDEDIYSLQQTLEIPNHLRTQSHTYLSKLIQLYRRKAQLRHWFHTRNISQWISVCKSELYTPTYDMKSLQNRNRIQEFLLPYTKDRVFFPLLMSIYQTYERHRQEYHLRDYEDLLLEPFHLLSTNSKILSFWQKKWSFFVTDEFQDSNLAQYHLVRLLSSHTRHWFVVGDTDQTIYGFRGSHEQIMQQFLFDFPECTQYSLTTNYRNTHTILEAAKEVIAHNPRETPKELYAHSNTSSPIRVASFVSAAEEAAWIAKDIKELQQRNPSWYIGVLYRHHHQEATLVEAFQREGVNISLLSSYASSFIQLSTLHGSKGLEYDAVYWPGFQEGIFPSPYASTQRELEEERRLCYVGFTRARYQLTLTFKGASSSFLKDIPRNLLSFEAS